jgi:hypothetical protein
MGCSGGTSLSEKVALVYCLDIRNDRFELVATVLLRGERPGWQRVTHPPDPRMLTRPRASGGGASAGRHWVLVDIDNRALWLNGSIHLPLNQSNIVMLDHADDDSKPPTLHSTHTINADLGAAPPDPLQVAFAAIGAAERLRERLEQFAPARAFY